MGRGAVALADGRAEASRRPAHDDGANRFPAVSCFRIIARPAAVKLVVKKSFVFHDIT
jgi:hypothetical protein